MSCYDAWLRFWVSLSLSFSLTFPLSLHVKVVRTCGVCSILTSTGACTSWSHITSAISDGYAPAALASLLFVFPEPQNIGTTHCSATFLPFRAPWSSSYWSSFYWLFLFWLLLFSASSHLFHLSVLSEVWLLNFLRKIRYKPNISIVKSYKYTVFSRGNFKGWGSRCSPYDLRWLDVWPCWPRRNRRSGRWIPPRLGQWSEVHL